MKSLPAFLNALGFKYFHLVRLLGVNALADFGKRTLRTRLRSMRTARLMSAPIPSRAAYSRYKKFFWAFGEFGESVPGYITSRSV